MEEHIMNRVNQIMEEYASLKQTADFDLSLEAVGSSGDVKVILKKDNSSIERVIGFKESLEWISDTFNYADTFHPRSKDMCLKALKIAYFDSWGRLVVEHDDSTEVFKVKDAQREEVKAILKEKLGNKFKG